MKNEENFISGIYNYCDRWCEKCLFSNQCRSFRAQPVEGEHSHDFEAEYFLDSLQESLQDAVQLLEQVAEERGLDWEEIQDAAENFEEEELAFTSPQLNLKEYSQQYHQQASLWLDSNEHLISQKEEEIQRKDDLGISVDQEVDELNDALSSIYHYLYFIHTKIGRALEGLHDEWMMAEYPTQNDANGTAKITLIAVEKSIIAWEIVRQQMPDAEDNVLDVLVLLSRLKGGMKKEFPRAEGFVRPGFDELGGAVSEL
jgi:hypothetical protein